MARFVLVHGGFSGAWVWLPLMDRLKAAGHFVEAFDLPGMGDDNTSASEVSLDSYAGRVCEVLAANSRVGRCKRGKWDRGNKTIGLSFAAWFHA